MQFTLTFEWNGKLVATAQATAVMAYEFANGFFEEQFAGMEFKTWHGASFINLLDDLISSMAHGKRFERTLEWTDPTGAARLMIRS